MKGSKVTTIIFDIETLGLSAEDPILCISWKTHKSPVINFRAAWNYPTWRCFEKAPSTDALEAAFQNLDKDFLQDVWDEFKTADCLVGHYENRFDIPFLKTRLIKHDIGFLPKCLQADTWRTARDHLKMRSNRLFHLNKFFDLTRKLKQSDLSLWHAVMANNRFAQRQMERYNIQDVRATEDLFEKLIGYVPLPILKQTRGRTCSCGSTRVYKEGNRATKTGFYQRYHCNDCGRWSRSLIKKLELRPE